MAKMGRPRQFDREEALRKAMALFWEYGYESTSLAQLKQAMGGISAASLYAAFGSKEALYKEAVSLYMATVGSQLREILDAPDADPLQAIERVLRTAVKNQLDDTRPQGCMVVLSATNCSPENEHLRQVMAGKRENTRIAFRDCIRRGIDSGRLQPDTDAESLAAFLSTVLNGLSIQTRDGLGIDMLNGIVDAAMAGVAAAAARPEALTPEPATPDIRR